MCICCQLASLISVDNGSVLGGLRQLLESLATAVHAGQNAAVQSVLMPLIDKLGAQASTAALASVAVAGTLLVPGGAVPDGSVLPEQPGPPQVRVIPASETRRSRAGGDDVQIGVNVANKLDVALAVGPTSVDYSTFEEGLRARLYSMNPPVLPEDLYVTAAKTLDVSTTAEFKWWEYDHSITQSLTTRRNGFTSNSTYNTHKKFYDYAIKQAWLGSSKTWTSSSPMSNTAGGVPSVEELADLRKWADSSGNPTTYAYGGISNTDRVYVDSSNLAGSSSSGDATKNQVKTSPDWNSTYHPCDGNLRHMNVLDSGATIEFCGYSRGAVKDFQYLPNDQKTKKVFEFGIQEYTPYDALDGTGFFFNLDIDENKPYQTGSSGQTMSGYLLFLNYGKASGSVAASCTSAGQLGCGQYLEIYKFQNINVKDFHDRNNTSSGTGSVDNIAQFPGFTRVAQSTAYDYRHQFRKIKLEVFPTYVKVYYRGSTTDSSYLTSAMPSDTAPLTFTTDSGSLSEVPLDSAYVKSYGFGPMVSYIGHGCARPTRVALRYLTMTAEKVKTLVEAVREPEWREGTIKYLVNLSEQEIEDFGDAFVTGELLNRLRNDDIYYVGWATNVNAVPSEQFLLKNDLKGLIVNMNEAPQCTPYTPGMIYPGDGNEYTCVSADPISAYDRQMNALAEKIYQYYWQQNDDNVVLTTDNVILNVTGGDQTGTADLAWPQGKWRVEHRADPDPSHPQEIGMSSFIDFVEHPVSGQYLSDLDLEFNLAGYYDIYYRDQYIKTIIAHRPPVADFDMSLSGVGAPTATVNLTSKAYDPDRSYDATTCLTQSCPADRGIAPENMTWSYLNLTAGDTEQHPINGPLTINDGDTYIVYLSVTDDLGATTSYSKQINYKAEPDANIQPPYAAFDINPKNVLRLIGPDEIVLTNTSYDLQGYGITSVYTLTKDGVAYPGYSFHEGVNTGIANLPAGTYVISMTVENEFCQSQGASAPTCKKSVTVSKTFTVVADTEAPTAAASQNNCVSGDPGCPFVGTTRITMQFTDTGGAGLASQRIVITNSPTPPATGDPANPDDPGWGAWSAPSSSSYKVATLAESGTLYIHWWAQDRAGNARTGTFGGYDLIKDNTTLALTASPDDSASYGSPASATVGSSPVVLTAQLGDAEINGSEIGFYLDGVYLGYAPVTNGVAVYTYSGPLAIGLHEFRAGWGGNGSYNAPNAAVLPYEIVAPDLVIGVSANNAPETASAMIGDIIRIDYKVKNDGKADASDVSAVLRLDSGLTLIDQANVGKPSPMSLSVGTLSPAAPSQSDFASGATWNLGYLPSIPPRPASRGSRSDPWQAGASVFAVVGSTGTFCASAQVSTPGGEAADMVWDDNADQACVEVTERVPSCAVLDAMLEPTPAPSSRGGEGSETSDELGATEGSEVPENAESPGEIGVQDQGTGGESDE